MFWLVFLLVSLSIAIPPAPKNPIAIFGDGQATLTWTAPATQESLLSYFVCVTPQGGSASCQSVTGTSLQKSGLTNLVSYSFNVSASSVFGAGPASLPSNTFIPRPTVSWTGSQSTLWSIPQNWSPNRVPLDSDVVSINNGITIALDTNATIYGLKSTGSSNIQCNAATFRVGYVSMGGTLTLSGGGVCELKLGSDGGFGTSMGGTTALATGWVGSLNQGSVIRVDSSATIKGAWSGLLVLESPLTGNGDLHLANGAQVTCQPPSTGLSFSTGLVLDDSTTSLKLQSGGAIYTGVVTLTAGGLTLADNALARVSGLFALSTGNVSIGVGAVLAVKAFTIKNGGTNLIMSGASETSQVVITEQLLTDDVGCSDYCPNGCNGPNVLNLTGQGTLSLGALASDGTGVDLSVANNVAWAGGGGGAHTWSVGSGWVVRNTANNTLSVRQQEYYCKKGSAQVVGSGLWENAGVMLLAPNTSFTLSQLSVQSPFRQQSSASLVLSASGVVFRISDVASNKTCDVSGSVNGAAGAQFVANGPCRVSADSNFSPPVLAFGNGGPLTLADGAVVYVPQILATSSSTILIGSGTVLGVARMTIQNSASNFNLVGGSNTSQVVITEQLLTDDVGCSDYCPNGCNGPNVLNLTGQGTLSLGALASDGTGVDLSVANNVAWAGGGGGAHTWSVGSGWVVRNTANNTLSVRQQEYYCKKGSAQVVGSGLWENAGAMLLAPNTSFTLSQLTIDTIFTQTSGRLDVLGALTFSRAALASQWVAGNLFLNGTLTTNSGFILDPTTVIWGSGRLKCGTDSLPVSEVLLRYNSTCIGPAPSSCFYSSRNFTCVVGTAIAALVPSCSSGKAVAFSISPPLSDGLVFDSSTGRISGTPGVGSSQTLTLYNVTASNYLGWSTFNITIRVNPYSCTAGSYCPDPSTIRLCPEGNYCPANSVAPIPCSKNANCPAGAAVASCFNGFSGANCDRCLSGRYGPTCASCPLSRQYVCNGVGTCDGDGTLTGNGTCNCSSGWSGDACETCAGTVQKNWKKDCSDCSSSYFGAVCQSQCSCRSDCIDGFTGNGSCLCSDASRGLYCTKHGNCNPTTGECTCLLSGSYGEFCQYDGLKEGRDASGALGFLLSLLIIVNWIVAHRHLRDANEEWRTKLPAIEPSKSAIDLGEKKQTAERPASCSNTMTLLYFVSLAVDVITSCGFVFQRSIPWHKSIEPVQTAFQGTILIFQRQVFYPILAFCFVLAILYAVFLLPFFIQNGKFIAKWLSGRSCWVYMMTPAPVIAFICSVGFVSIVNTFFRALACTYTGVGLAPYLDADPGVRCWSSEHSGYVCLSVFGLLFLVPSIFLTKPRYDLKLSADQPQEIFVLPTFVVQQMVGAIVMAAVSTFLTQYPVLIVIATAAVSASLCMATLRHPITPSHVNAVRVGGYLFVFYCSFCGIIAAGINNKSSALPLALLGAGLLLSLLTWIGVQLRYIRNPFVALHFMHLALKRPDNTETQTEGWPTSPSGEPTSPSAREPTSPSGEFPVGGEMPVGEEEAEPGAPN